MEDQLQLSYVNFKQGAYIVVEGNQNTGCFYIIQQGKVRISKEAIVKGEGNEILGPGDFIGVVSTMSSHSHIETAQALTDLALIKVHQQHYIGLIKKNAPVAMKIIMHFSKRLRHLNKTLAELALHNTAEEGPSHLYNVAEYFFNQRQYVLAYYAYDKYMIYCPQEEKALLVKEKLLKMASFAKEIQVDFNADQFNRIYRKNTMIFAEGEPGAELFIILKGAVKITKVVDNSEVLLAILRAGDIFGEMALLDGKPRLASAIAYSDTNVQAVNKANFEQMVYNQPQLIAKITTLLAERIWLIYKKLVNALMLDPMGRIYDTLLTQLERNHVPLTGNIGQASHTFYFGWAELVGMAGLPIGQSSLLLTKIMKNPKIQILDDKIHISSIMEIIRQTEYYRKMDRRDKLKQGHLRISSQ